MSSMCSKRSVGWWPTHLVAAAAACLGFGTPLLAQPANNTCASATHVTVGMPVTATMQAATNDGDSFCNLELTGDVYHQLVTPVTGTYTFSLCSNTLWDSVISLHSSCPATRANNIACDDDGCRPPGSEVFGIASSLTVDLPAGQTYTLRISAFDTVAVPGIYTLNVIGPAPAIGGCCVAGNCGMQTQAICAAAAGSYRGDWNLCVARAGNTTAYAGPAGPFPIPDNTAHSGGIASTVTVADTFTVSDVQVELNLLHPYAGDLTATLSHGSPPQIATLFQRIGGGQYGDDSDFDGLYTLTDGGLDTVWRAAVVNAPDSTSIVPTAPHRAVDPFANTVSLRSVFGGQSAAGNWTLRISDNNLADAGSLIAWRLVLDRSGGDPCDLTTGACCHGSTCSLLPVGGCAGPNRAFAGAGTICNAAGNLVSPCCKADFNHVGGITVQDIFDFIAAYFQTQPTADVNGGGLSVQDLFDFLVGYFQPCA